MQMTDITDGALLAEIERRFEEKKASVKDMELMTKELLELNEQNKNSQEVKSKFLSLIKNEFNNPMSSLLNIANLMSKKAIDPQVSELSSMMKTELLRLDFSLKNIFAASEIEAGEIANDYSNVNLREIFDEVEEYFSYLIQEKSLRLNYKENTQDILISDSQKLEIILLNLISNACEYSYAQSEIDITVESNDSEYIISVEDSGEGVYAENSKDIYNRFSHFETGKTRATAGIGLGLSVVRGMVQALDGTIENSTKEKKTIFKITLKKVDESEVDISTGISSNGFLFDDGDGMVEF